MRLDILDLRRLNTSTLAGTLHHTPLGQTIRSHQTIRTPILVHSTPTNNSIDWIMITLRQSQRLQHNNSNALTSYVAIRSLVKGFATSISCHHTSLTKIDRKGWR
jgi:hypothetical protein